ncbi:hypothetical protein [Iningainema tapete]|uniref:hypothetical protein n=1 Tax=Iningainema tapete TaxID=2806730 RepID=UPI001EE337FD|nr:hypothetical protein [Iningainema tapete]
MPRIFDNINLQLLPILRSTLKVSYRADFCVGYFNLRGWRKLDDLIEQYVGSEGACCRLLIGMQNHESDEVQAACLTIYLTFKKQQFNWQRVMSPDVGVY